MTKDEFVFNFEKEVIENRLVFFLNWTFRKTAKAWTSKKSQPMVLHWKSGSKIHSEYNISHSCQWLKHYRATHILEGSSAILISNSELHKHWRGLTSWRCVQPFSSMALIHSNTKDGLTNWRCVQPFSSVALICSNTKEGLTSWRGVQPFSSVALICSNTGKGLTAWRVVQPFSSVVLICSNTREGLTNWRVAHQ